MRGWGWTAALALPWEVPEDRQPCMHMRYEGVGDIDVGVGGQEKRALTLREASAASGRARVPTRLALVAERGPATAS